MDSQTSDTNDYVSMTDEEEADRYELLHPPKVDEDITDEYRGYTEGADGGRV